MEINKIRQELSALEASLDNPDLSVNDLDNLAEHVSAIFRRTKTEQLGTPSSPVRDIQESSDDRVAELASRILDRTSEVKMQKIERDVSLLPLLSELDAKVTKLILTQFDQEPEDVAEEIADLGREIEGLEAVKPASVEVREKLNEVKGKVEDLIFSFAFPVMHELASHPGTFAHTLRGISCN